MLARSSEEPTESLERELDKLSPEQKKAIADKYSPEPEMPSNNQEEEEEEVTIEVPEPEEPKPMEPGTPDQEPVADDDDMPAAA